MKKPAFPTEKDLIESWIIFEESKNGSQQYEDNFWTFEYFSDLTYEHPLECYEIMIKILNMNISEDSVVSIGCGILEDLLGHNGDLIIDRLENDIKSNQKLNQAIQHTWKYSTDDKLWSRIMKLKKSNQGSQ